MKVYELHCHIGWLSINNFSWIMQWQNVEGSLDGGNHGFLLDENPSLLGE